MLPPSEDLERRRPVWEAMSAVFLDTEIDETWLDDIVKTLRRSGYSSAELDRILWGELCPVLWKNLVCVAGKWKGFDMEYVEQQIISRPAGWCRRWWAYINGGNVARHDWRRIQQAMHRGTP